MKLLFFLLTLALLIPSLSFAEQDAASDSLKTIEPGLNNGLMALDLGLLTVGVWSPSRILGTEWAYIGFNTMKQNLKTYSARMYTPNSLPVLSLFG